MLTLKQQIRKEERSGPTEAYREEMRGRGRQVTCLTCYRTFWSCWKPIDCPQCGAVVK
jgi:hypothetical protein